MCLDVRGGQKANGVLVQEIPVAQPMRNIWESPMNHWHLLQEGVAEFIEEQTARSRGINGAVGRHLDKVGEQDIRSRPGTREDLNSLHLGAPD
jgi:hypothetical protein